LEKGYIRGKKFIDYKYHFHKCYLRYNDINYKIWEIYAIENNLPKNFPKKQFKIKDIKNKI
jgi:hypothetical protein